MAYKGRVETYPEIKFMLGALLLLLAATTLFSHNNDDGLRSSLATQEKESLQKVATTSEKIYHDLVTSRKEISGCELTWTEHAQGQINDMIEKIQHPEECRSMKKIVIEMDVSGLLWNFQSLVRAIALGLQLNRTVIPIPRRPGGPHWQHATFDGCGQHQHLGCFFPNITTCSPPENFNYSDFASWNFSCRGECLKTKILEVNRQEVLFLSPLNSGYSGWAPDLVSEAFWKTLIENPCVYFHECNTSDFIVHINSQPPIFMLHAITSKWIFDNTNRPAELETDILKANAGWKTPVAAIHMRRTDKMKEDPYWNANGHTYRSSSDYLDALQKATASRSPWGSIFLLTDSEHALEEVKEILRSKGNTSIMFNSLENRTIMETVGGHAFIPPDLKYGMQLQFLSTVSLARKVSEFAVGALSSNVFRVLLQLIGAENKCAQASRSGPIAYSFDTSEGSVGWAG